MTWVNDNTTSFDLTTTYVPFGRPLLAFPELSKYCAPKAADYSWGNNGTRAYENNTCVPYYLPSEFTERQHHSVWLYTYWKQLTWARACVDAKDVPKYYVPDPPDWPVAPDEEKLRDFLDPGYVPNCADPVLQSQRSVLTVAPERLMNVTIIGSYTTTWGRTRSAMATVVTAREGTTPVPDADGVTHTRLAFAADEEVTTDFATLLSLGGINLDAPNELTDGGRGPANGTKWPTFRITGVKLMAQMKYNNFIENATWPDPFNFEDRLEIAMYAATLGTFNSPGPRLFYLGKIPAWHTQAGADEPYPYADSLFMTREPQGVQLDFDGSGEIGRFDMKVLLGALITIVVLSDAAQSVTDITAGFLINGFRSQKYMDDLELRIRLMLRSELRDSPVPEQVRMFEAETLELYSNRAYAASQRTRMMEMERLAAEKMTGVSEAAAAADAAAAAEAAAAAAAAAAADAPPPYSSLGASLRTVVTGPPPPPAPGAAPGLASVVPRVAKLLIAGEPVHGAPLTAQGFLENCRCVRFQWLRSADGQTWEAIAFATLPTFFPTVDDVGCFVAVDATPVTDDGFEGGPKRARIGPLRTSPVVAERAAALVSAAREPDGCAISDGITRGGSRCVLTLRSLDVSLRASARGGGELGRLPIVGTRCDLDRRDGRVLDIVGAGGGDAAPSLAVTFGTPEQRDEVVMALRTLAAGAAGPPPAPEGPTEAPTDDEAD
jgi:hypothetical protein